MRALRDWWYWRIRFPVRCWLAMWHAGHDGETRGRFFRAYSRHTTTDEEGRDGKA